MQEYLEYFPANGKKINIQKEAGSLSNITAGCQDQQSKLSIMALFPDNVQKEVVRITLIFKWKEYLNTQYIFSAEAQLDTIDKFYI